MQKKFFTNLLKFLQTCLNFTNLFKVINIPAETIPNFLLQLNSFISKLFPCAMPTQSTMATDHLTMTRILFCSNRQETKIVQKLRCTETELSLHYNEECSPIEIARQQTWEFPQVTTMLSLSCLRNNKFRTLFMFQQLKHDCKAFSNENK